MDPSSRSGPGTEFTLSVGPPVVLHLCEVLHIHAIAEEFPYGRERVLNDPRCSRWFTRNLLDRDHVRPPQRGIHRMMVESFVELLGNAHSGCTAVVNHVTTECTWIMPKCRQDRKG